MTKYSLTQKTLLTLAGLSILTMTSVKAGGDPDGDQVVSHVRRDMAREDGEPRRLPQEPAVVLGQAAAAPSAPFVGNTFDSDVFDSDIDGSDAFGSDIAGSDAFGSESSDSGVSDSEASDADEERPRARSQEREEDIDLATLIEEAVGLFGGKPYTLVDKRRLAHKYYEGRPGVDQAAWDVKAVVLLKAGEGYYELSLMYREDRAGLELSKVDRNRIAATYLNMHREIFPEIYRRYVPWGEDEPSSDWMVYGVM